VNIFLFQIKNFARKVTRQRFFFLPKEKSWELPLLEPKPRFHFKSGNPPSDSAVLTVFETLKNIDF